MYWKEVEKPTTMEEKNNRGKRPILQQYKWDKSFQRSIIVERSTKVRQYALIYYKSRTSEDLIVEDGT